jgi:cobalt/nickel transport protein
MHTKIRSLTVLVAAASTCGTLLSAAPASAHFQMLIPDDDMVAQKEAKTIKLDLRFWHPLEGHGMNMAKPTQFGVLVDGQKQNLLDTLNAQKTEDHAGEKRDTFLTSYTLKRPGDHIFYVEPVPYWEPAEEKFIVHYTKTVVNAFGMERGWDAEVGLKTEIVPLTRPYGLWAGNVFQGMVKVNGKPVPFTEVEVEYFNLDGSVTPPADPLITQVVKADANGVFTYAMPWGGWWGFAALNEDDKPMQHEGKDYPVEIGALMWVYTYERH